MHPLEHRCHSHRIYRLDCDDVAELWGRTEGRCRLCRVAPQDTLHGQLHIDHDPRVGAWAVRDLLCSPCNTGLGKGMFDAAQVAAYEADAWYLKFNIELPPEPPVGTVLGASSWRRYTRTATGWSAFTALGRPRSGQHDLAWEDLWYREGPRALLVSREHIRKIVADA